MRWVDDPKYVGLDRRKDRADLRLRERRRINKAGEPPSLASAIRRLSLRVIDARTPTGLAAFCKRTRETSQLAKELRNGAVADSLTKLALKLEASHGADMRPVIEAELKQVLLIIGAATYSFR